MKTAKEKIDAYFAAKDRVHALFGYKPDYVEIPMDDCRGEYWMLVGGEGHDANCVHSNESFSMASIEAGKTIYGNPIYTQRFLPRWVYRTKDYVLVSVDTQTDGNRYLRIFDADKECTDDRLRNAYAKHWGSP